MNDTAEATNGQAQAPAAEAPAPPPRLNLSPEVIAACARQDLPSATAAELRAQIALIGERARRVAIEAEYHRLFSLPHGEPSSDA